MPQSDLIVIRGLEIATVIGIHDWEREECQLVRLDLTLHSDCRAAAATDAIADALDYDAVSRRVTGFVEASRFQLIETLAERVAELLLTEFAIGWLRLELIKPGAVANAREVGVIIERGDPGASRSRQSTQSAIPT